MKILVTGGLGHIGSSLIRKLPVHFPGCETIILDNLKTQRFCSLFDLPESASYKFFEKDILDCDLNHYLHDVDYVVHLAALTDAASSFGMAAQVEGNNFNATVKLADACLESGTSLITLSSTSVYGSQSSVVDEECSREELRPQSPYAETKLREEEYVKQLAKKGLKVTILRFGTIYGVSAGMRFHTAVNKFCWQAVMGNPITIWSGAYDQKRPYLDLGDAMSAIGIIINKGNFGGEIFNVLTENLSVREVVSQIELHIPNLQKAFVDHEIMNQLSYEVLCEKINQMGFHANGNIGCGIEQTIELLRNSNSVR